MFDLNDDNVQGSVKEFPVCKQNKEKPSVLTGVPARLVDIKKYEPTAKAGCSIAFVYSYHPTKEGKPNTSDVNFGAQTEHRIFDPEGGSAVLSEDKMKKNIDAIQSALKHTIGCFATPEEMKEGLKSASDFDTLIDNIITLFSGLSYKDTPCKVKVTFNKNGYLTFPRYPNFVSTQLKPSEFKYDPNWDLLQRQEQAPTQSDSLAPDLGGGMGADDDMPF